MNNYAHNVFVESVKERIDHLMRKLAEAHEDLDAIDHSFNPRRYRLCQSISAMQHEIESLKKILESDKKHGQASCEDQHEIIAR
jgi:hypothetical protein